LNLEYTDMKILKTVDWKTIGEIAIVMGIATAATFLFLWIGIAFTRKAGISDSTTYIVALFIVVGVQGYYIWSLRRWARDLTNTNNFYIDIIRRRLTDVEEQGEEE